MRGSQKAQFSWWSLGGADQLHRQEHLEHQEYQSAHPIIPVSSLVIIFVYSFTKTDGDWVKCNMKLEWKIDARRISRA